MYAYKLVAMINVKRPPGPCHTGSQILSPTHASKSQHGDKVPTFGPQDIIKKWLIIVKIGSLFLSAKIFARFMLRIGSSFFLTHLNTSPKASSPKSVFTCRASLSYLRPRVKWSVPTSMLSTTEIAWMTWDLGLGSCVNGPQSHQH